MAHYLPGWYTCRHIILFSFSVSKESEQKEDWGGEGLLQHSCGGRALNFAGNCNAPYKQPFWAVMATQLPSSICTSSACGWCVLEHQMEKPGQNQKLADDNHTPKSIINPWRICYLSLFYPISNHLLRSVEKYLNAFWCKKSDFFSPPFSPVFSHKSHLVYIFFLKIVALWDVPILERKNILIDKVSNWFLVPIPITLHCKWPPSREWWCYRCLRCSPAVYDNWSL